MHRRPTAPSPAALAAVLTLVLSAAPALAQEAMSAAEFDAYVDGQTVTFAHDGRVYGLEQYLPGRRVVWRQIGGDCQEGTWFEADGLICFDYDTGVPLQCWQFYDTGSGLGARSDGDPEGLWLYEVQRTPDPIQCPAPYLGS